jgi:hypothetical protein
MPPKQPATEQSQPLPESSRQGIPFAGVWLAAPEPVGEQQATGTRVLGIVAGPAAVAGLRANDLIVRIDNVEVDTDRAYAIIGAAMPGDRLVLEVIRDNEPMTMTMTIDPIERWLPPSNFKSAVPFTATGLSEPPVPPDRVMPQILKAAPQIEPIVTRIDRMFADLARDDTGYHKLPLIRSAMLNPATMDRWRDDLAETLRPYELERSAVVEVMCNTLALECTPTTQSSTSGLVSLQQFAEAIDDANNQVRALFDAARIDRELAHADLHYLMRTTAADRTLIGQPEAHRGIHAMQISMRVDLAVLLDAAGQIVINAEQLPEISGANRQPPAELEGIVEGSIVDYKKIDGGYVVIGGADANRYDMNKLYAVIDAGGNDSYQWDDAVALETQTIVDLGGDDTYHAKTGGPAAGWLGVAVLIDLAGSDQYASELGGSSGSCSMTAAKTTIGVPHGRRVAQYTAAGRSSIKVSKPTSIPRRYSVRPLAGRVVWVSWLMPAATTCIAQMARSSPRTTRRGRTWRSARGSVLAFGPTILAVSVCCSISVVTIATMAVNSPRAADTCGASGCYGMNLVTTFTTVIATRKASLHIRRSACSPTFPATIFTGPSPLPHRGRRGINPLPFCSTRKVMTFIVHIH